MYKPQFHEKDVRVSQAVNVLNQTFAAYIHTGGDLEWLDE